jgi:hypothetical protein
MIRRADTGRSSQQSWMRYLYLTETGILLPNNQRQHRTLHAPNDVLPPRRSWYTYVFCSPPSSTHFPQCLHTALSCSTLSCTIPSAAQNSQMHTTLKGTQPSMPAHNPQLPTAYNVCTGPCLEENCSQKSWTRYTSTGTTSCAQKSARRLFTTLNYTLPSISAHYPQLHSTLHVCTIPSTIHSAHCLHNTLNYTAFNYVLSSTYVQ